MSYLEKVRLHPSTLPQTGCYNSSPLEQVRYLSIDYGGVSFVPRILSKRNVTTGRSLRRTAKKSIRNGIIYLCPKSERDWTYVPTSGRYKGADTKHSSCLENRQLASMLPISLFHFEQNMKVVMCHGASLFLLTASQHCTLECCIQKQHQRRD